MFKEVYYSNFEIKFWKPQSHFDIREDLFDTQNAYLVWVFTFSKHTNYSSCSETVVWHLHLLALIHFFQNYDLFPITSENQEYKR